MSHPSPALATRLASCRSRALQSADNMTTWGSQGALERMLESRDELTEALDELIGLVEDADAARGAEQLLLPADPDAYLNAVEDKESNPHELAVLSAVVLGVSTVFETHIAYVLGRCMPDNFESLQSLYEEHRHDRQAWEEGGVLNQAGIRMAILVPSDTPIRRADALVQAATAAVGQPVDLFVHTKWLWPVDRPVGYTAWAGIRLTS